MLALCDFHELASIYRSLLAMGLLTGPRPPGHAGTGRHGSAGARGHDLIAVPPRGGAPRGCQDGWPRV